MLFCSNHSRILLKEGRAGQNLARTGKNPYYSGESFTYFLPSNRWQLFSNNFGTSSLSDSWVSVKIYLSTSFVIPVGLKKYNSKWFWVKILLGNILWSKASTITPVPSHIRSNFFLSDFFYFYPHMTLNVPTPSWYCRIYKQKQNNVHE